MTQADRKIAAIATGQLGAFTRTQANDSGLSDRQLRSRVQSGFLIKSGPNVFRYAGAPVSLESELRALMMDIGDPVWACGPTAAALHGFDGYRLRRPFHLLIPDDRNVRRAGSVIHQSAVIPLIDVAVADGVAATSAARTVIDLARVGSPEQLLAAIESALLLGVVSEDLLFRRIGALRSKGRFGMPALLQVLDRRACTSGTESWLESEYLRILDRANLLRPVTQVVLAKANDHLVRVDCFFPGTNLVVELLGYRYHRSRTDLNRDATRLNALMSGGYTPYQFTFDDVVERPEQTVLATKHALDRAIRVA